MARWKGKSQSSAMMKVRATLESMKYDVIQEYQETKSNPNFWLVATAAFATYGGLGLYYGTWSGWTFARKVIAGGLMTTMVMWWFLRPAYKWCCVKNLFGLTDGQRWLKNRQTDYAKWAIGRIEKKELKQQIKADSALRERLIARILNVNAYLPLPLNYCYQGPIGVNPKVNLYHRVSLEDIEKDVDKMMEERHGGVYAVDRYEKWEQSLPPL